MLDKLDARSNPLFQHTLVINGQVGGTWKRTFKKDAVIIQLRPFAPLTKPETQTVSAAAGVGIAAFAAQHDMVNDIITIINNRDLHSLFMRSSFKAYSK